MSNDIYDLNEDDLLMSTDEEDFLLADTEQNKGN